MKFENSRLHVEPDTLAAALQNQTDVVNSKDKGGLPQIALMGVGFSNSMPKSIWSPQGFLATAECLIDDPANTEQNDFASLYLDYTPIVRSSVVKAGRPLEVANKAYWLACDALSQRAAIQEVIREQARAVSSRNGTAFEAEEHGLFRAVGVAIMIGDAAMCASVFLDPKTEVIL